MRKLLAILAVMVMSVALALPASADLRGPCSGDGSDYGQHHIAARARIGAIGNGGHIPGTHMGFSFCL